MEDHSPPPQDSVINRVNGSHNERGRAKMEKHIPVIQEFIARKEQILNLETRLFLIVFVLELIFVLFYFYGQNKLRDEKLLAGLALSVYLVLFFEMIAINGKMGLISTYLRQLESFLASQGYQGIIWESVALDKIIFVPGNAFTLPAGVTILVLLFQTFYVFYFTSSAWLDSKRNVFLLVSLLSIVTIFIVVKSLTVDFYQKQPNLFNFQLQQGEK
jgi:hypothetical protein